MKIFSIGWLPLILTLALLPGASRAEEGADAPAAKASDKSMAQRLKDLENKLAAYEESTDQKFSQIHEDQLHLHFNLYGDAEYRLFGPSGPFPNPTVFISVRPTFILWGVTATI